MRGQVALLASLAALSLAAPAQAAPFTVDDLSDASDETIDGLCDATGADTCTLRAALDEANLGSGGDTITIAPPGQIDLTLGPLATSPDTAETITVNGNASGTTIDSDSADRVVTVNGSGSVVLNDLSLIGGNAPTDTNGGGVVVVGGSLTLNRVNVSGNTVNSASGGAAGGGISTFPPPLTTLELTNSTISGNSSGGVGGGGIFASNDGTLQVVGSTIAGNSTTGTGGGIKSFGPGSAENSIFAGNTAVSGSDCLIVFSPAENNIDGGLTCGLGTGNGNQENVTPTQLALAPLANNGGPTETRALGTGSVALNAASNDCGGLTTDQRGVSRPQGTACDVGAFEREVVPQPPGPGPTTTAPAPITAPPVTQPPAKAKKKCKKKKGRSAAVAAKCKKPKK